MVYLVGFLSLSADRHQLRTALRCLVALPRRSFRNHPQSSFRVHLIVLESFPRSPPRSFHALAAIAPRLLVGARPLVALNCAVLLGMNAPHLFVRSFWSWCSVALVAASVFVVVTFAIRALGTFVASQRATKIRLPASLSPSSSFSSPHFRLRRRLRYRCRCRLRRRVVGTTRPCASSSYTANKRVHCTRASSRAF